jgi:hypothetical protein
MPAVAARNVKPETDPSSAMSVEETLLLIEGWLRAEPGLSFKRVSSDARNLNVTVTPRQYAEAKRRLGITAAPPRAATPRPASNRMNDTQAAPTTPLMSFVVDYLRNNADASFQDVRTAASAQGFSVAPINYGNARRILGLAPKAKQAGSRRSRRARRAAAEGEPAPAAAGGRRGRKRKLDFSNLSNLVTELQEVVAERDRLLAALDQIAAIIRNV